MSQEIHWKDVSQRSDPIGEVLAVTIEEDERL